MIAVVLVAVGLFLNIVGAIMFSWSELRSTASLIRYYGTDEGKALFDSQLRRMPWWRRRVLLIARKCAPADVVAMEREPVLEMFPFQAVGLLVLVIGSSMQVVGAFLPLWQR